MAAQLREIDVSNRFANPPTMPAPRGYTQVVETIGPGRTIYLSGQLGMTPDGAFAGAPVSTFWEGKRDLDVTLRLDGAERSGMEDVSAAYLISPTTGAIPRW